MLSKLLATTLLPLTALSSPLALSARELPASVGTVTQFRYSGNGCTQGSNSVTRSGGWVTQTYKFSQFEADTITAGTPTTENCELHFQGAGLSPGWQVSLASADVTGSLVLAPDSKINYYWQVYWSDDAADTVSLDNICEICLTMGKGHHDADEFPRSSLCKARSITLGARTRSPTTTTRSRPT